MRHPTILDVARRAGVSKSLVSLVMRGSPQVSAEKRAAVLAAAEEIGYRPNAAARALVRRRSQIVGVLISDLHNPFFAEVVDGIDAALAEVDYRTLLNTGNRVVAREMQAVDTLLELRIDGLILGSPAVASDVIEAAGQTVPTVVVGMVPEAPDVDTVTNDDRMGARLVVDYLAELGHDAIAHIHGGPGAGAATRRKGYEDAMTRRGCAPRVVEGSFTEEGGVSGMRELLDRGSLPTAVFVANDYAALGVLDVLDDAGLDVPGDMSVVGYDNVRMVDHRRIGLTTVDQPRFDMGHIAATLLLERLEEGRTDLRHIVVPPKLVVRDTTGPPRLPS